MRRKCFVDELNFQFGWFSSTHLSLCLSTFGPQCLAPFLLQLKVLEGFLDDACWCCEWELNDELCQMQVADWILLSRHAGQWTVDENLQLSKHTLISFVILCGTFRRWWGKNSQKKYKIINSFYLHVCVRRLLLLRFIMIKDISIIEH